MTIHTGAPLNAAAGAVVLVHGRGATAEGILDLAGATRRTDLAFLAPQAAGGAWYPYPFIAPIEQNEPYLSDALATVAAVVAEIEAAGLGRERIVLGGFSQGACLTLEFAARNAARWGGVAGLAGGLIGPPGTSFDYATRFGSGSFSGTPVFLGCAERDPHIPLSRVEETASVLTGMGAAVDARIYPGNAHTVPPDAFRALGAMLDAL